MSVRFEDLRVLQVAEQIADELWKVVVVWEEFAKDTVGKQLVRATDSIGANIAEGYGRYHYGEKLQIFYFARGSIFETKYWLNRAKSRELIAVEKYEKFAANVSGLAHQLNTLVRATKRQRSHEQTGTKTIRERQFPYQISPPPTLEEFLIDYDLDLFTPEEIEALSH